MKMEISTFKIEGMRKRVSTQQNDTNLKVRHKLFVSNLVCVYVEHNVYFEKKAEFGVFSNELKNGKIELESQNQRIVAQELLDCFFSPSVYARKKKSNPKARE